VAAFLAGSFFFDCRVGLNLIFRWINFFSDFWRAVFYDGVLAGNFSSISGSI
jgi:hypothetical protein